jgi:iron-sulfur cluster repair protein YtfE (RIC family)
MNAIEFLLKEHDRIRNAFADIDNESHRETTKKEMFNALCQDLIRHETMEQKIWYPHLKQNEKLASIINHLLMEEKTAAKTIKEFGEIKLQDEWEEKFAEFKEDVEHHAAEEESLLFPKVMQILDDTSLEKIGSEMREFKAEFKVAYK